jgi:hypothetical protein
MYSCIFVLPSRELYDKLFFARKLKILEDASNLSVTFTEEETDFVSAIPEVQTDTELPFPLKAYNPCLWQISFCY